MPKAREHDVDVPRLCTAMQRSRYLLRRFREERREMVRHYVGNHWSEYGTQEKVPVNLIALYCQIVGRSLISKNPRLMLSTFTKADKPQVAAIEAWANRQIVEMRLATTLSRVVLDSLFSVGITKVALATPADASQAQWNMKAGTPYAERVDLDDFVFDLHARDFSEVGFIGHRYRVPLASVRDSSLYSKARKELAPSDDRPYNLEGDERISTLGRGPYGMTLEDFEDYVTLWEVYLPRQRLVLTLADDNMTGGTTDKYAEALREQEWLGPDVGPYHILGLNVVPGNAMPKGPVQDLVDLHESVNRIYRKLIRQAERQKEVLGVSGGATEDGARTVNASDGEAIRVDNPEQMRVVGYGGPNQANFLLCQHLKDLFSWAAGNLNIMGGLSPEAKTATQDKMLNANSSRTVADMQETVVTYTSRVANALCWYWYHDPFTTMKTQHSLPGLPHVSIPRVSDPQGRAKMKWQDMDVKVDPYSLQQSTPESRIAGLNQIVTSVITPMMGLLQQQGIMFDMGEYLKKIGHYTDDPDLQDIVSIQEPPERDQTSANIGGSDAGATKPPSTSREYVRRSLGQDSSQAKDAGMKSITAGQWNGSSQNAQMNPGG